MSDSTKLVPRNSSDDQLRIVVLAILVPGIVLSAMVLLAFAYTASQRRSRPHLRRVSFRLLVYALVSNFILGLTLIPMETLMTGPISSAGCAFAAFASNASLLFSACMYFCMALNLQLVLVHGVNGLMMEKYYMMGSSILVAVCNITPLAVKGQFGFYDDLCWFSNPDPALRYRWLVGTQSFWLFLMASSELVCFVILILYMLRRRMVMRRIHSEISSDMTRTQHAAYDAAPILQFRAIILRITLYPLLSCALGFSGTTLDLWLAKHVLENTDLKVKLTALDQCIFNARPFLYALLAATDPSFLRAVAALRPGAGSQRSISTVNSQQSAHSTTHLFSWTPADGSRGEVESSISMATRSVDGQTEANVHHTCTHRDPVGIERHSNFESCKDSIEYQI
ncbi:hypothetical protein C8R45DRAFT_883472 [Mycena sanguinolenta]|nr:hypothetical protein C8R45DRAFT_883472 [Mycena sanguinolenta]